MTAHLTGPELVAALDLALALTALMILAMKWVLK